MIRKLHGAKHVYGSLITAILILLLSYLQNAAYGNTPKIMEVTVYDAMNLASGRDNSIAKMGLTINSLNRQYDSIRQSKAGFLDKLQRFKELYAMDLDEENGKERLENGEITREEYEAVLGCIGEFNSLFQYFAGLGVIEPLTMEEDDYFIIKKFDFPMHEIGTQIENIENNKRASANSIERNILKLYDSILNLQDSISIQQKMVDNNARLYSKALLDYDMGRISVSDRFLSEAMLKESKLSLDMMKRNLENLMNDLKGSIGVGFEIDLQLKPYDAEDSSLNLLSCDEYINKALAERTEVTNTKNELELKEKEFDITAMYINDTSHMDFKTAQEAVLEKYLAYEDAVNSVKADIRKGYADVLSIEKALYTAKSRETAAKESYEKMKIEYEVGSISLSSLLNAEYLYSQSSINVKKASRDFYCGFLNLKQAAGPGPAYTAAKRGGN